MSECVPTKAQKTGEPDVYNAAEYQRRPQQRWKGIVEHLCGYAQSDLVVPLLTEAAVAGLPVSIPAANAAAVTWCAEVNAAVSAASLPAR